MYRYGIPKVRKLSIIKWYQFHFTISFRNKLDRNKIICIIIIRRNDLNES